MRKKDQAKINQIFNATLKIVNEIGFASSSISKIAKLANVSPATIYIYYQNKQDLLINTYLQIKQLMYESIFTNIEPTENVKESLHSVWLKTYHFLTQHIDFLLFIQQFEQCPYRMLIDENILKNLHTPLEKIFEKGIRLHHIKNLPSDVLMVFSFPPLMTLASNAINQKQSNSDYLVNLTFELVWDAIKQQ